MKLKLVSDDELLRRLSEILEHSRHLESELVAHIGEVDVRRLYAREASASMFSYCTEVLHLSESEAYLRICVARSARKFPIILGMLADGRLHLSGIAKLAPHLTTANHESLLERAAYRSKRKIEELVAEISPKPDVPASIRKLPERSGRTTSARAEKLRPDAVGRTESADSAHIRGSADIRPGVTKAPYVAPEPLSPTRYKIQFTASAEFRDKLERLRALMHSSVPDGDLGTLLEAAVTEKLERLESRRFGKTRTPRSQTKEKNTSTASRHIPAAVKRAVRERDGARCTFVGINGRRCEERKQLEYHHRNPYGKGGSQSPKNICLMCRTHNYYHAERDYGKERMERYRNPPDRISESHAIYRAGNILNLIGWRAAFSARVGISGLP
jgi:hypothetical protein